MISPISSVEAMQYLIAELSVRNNIDIQEIVAAWYELDQYYQEAEAEAF